MRVGEIMTSYVVTASPLTTLEQTARWMREHDIGALPVVAEGKLVGMISDRDIAVRGVAENRDGMFSRISDVMTDEVFHCREYESVEAVAGRMARLQVHRLPVLDADDRLVGIISLGDVARWDKESAARALGEISRPVLKVVA